MGCSLFYFFFRMRALEINISQAYKQILMDIIKLRKIKIKTDNIIHVIYNFFYKQGFILLNIIQEQTFNLS